MSGVTLERTAKRHFWNKLNELLNNVGDIEWAEVRARVRTHPQEVSVQGASLLLLFSCLIDKKAFHSYLNLFIYRLQVDMDTPRCICPATGTRQQPSFGLC